MFFVFGCKDTTKFSYMQDFDNIFIKLIVRKLRRFICRLPGFLQKESGAEGRKNKEGCLTTTQPFFNLKI